MSRTVRWTSQALEDLRGIADYIGEDDPDAADRWVSKLESAAASAADAPLAARVVPEMNDESVREVFVRRYRIIYGVRETHILVFTVFRGDRQLRPEWLDDDE